MLCQRTFSSVFRAVLLQGQTAQFNLECMGPFREMVMNVGRWMELAEEPFAFLQISFAFLQISFAEISLNGAEP